MCDLSDLKKGPANFFKNHIFEVLRSNGEKWAISCLYRHQKDKIGLKRRGASCAAAHTPGHACHNLLFITLVLFSNPSDRHLPKIHGKIMNEKVNSTFPLICLLRLFTIFQYCWQDCIISNRFYPHEKNSQEIGVIPLWTHLVFQRELYHT